MEKIKAVFDRKITWAAIGSAVGIMFGDQAAQAVGALGVAVMAFL
jgi:hypothetical protein